MSSVTLLLVIALMLLLVVAILLWLVLQELMAIVTEIESLTSEVRNFRLKARTRVVQASMPTGAPTQEGELRRVGRTTRAARVVVGGDPDSQQYKDLERQVVKRAGDDDND